MCRKIQGGSFKPPKMAQLPAQRVQRSPAFKFTGLDYAGPLQIRNKPGEEHQKRWIAIFVCFATRAIHLEIVRDCSAESAAQAVLRFIGRRGTPHTILTDNALQFKKGSSILEAIWSKKPDENVQETLTTFFTNNGIHWKYIPERSPWVGGFYERLIGLVKKALKKTLWKATIDEQALQTLTIQIEAAINSRPLIAPSSEVQDILPLAPADFIAPVSQLNAPPTGEDPEDPDYDPDPRTTRALLNQWKKIQTKLDQFWRIWQTQYLQELRETHSSHFRRVKGDVQRLPKVGEVCLIKENSPRVTWKMCRVQQLLEASDGEVRFVSVKLPSGFVTKRGVKDLVPLETDFLQAKEETVQTANILIQDGLFKSQGLQPAGQTVADKATTTKATTGLQDPAPDQRGSPCDASLRTWRSCRFINSRNLKKRLETQRMF
jgi:hypothetical protein